MNNIFQFIGTFASIFSIPLAIILYFKTSDARQNKIRLEIIRSLSYQIGEGNMLSKMEVSAVFHSKLREYNIRKPIFNEVSILEDIVADAVSNPFLSSEQKTSIIKNVSDILQSYGVAAERKESGENIFSVMSNSYYSSKKNNSLKMKRNAGNIFALIVTLLSVIITVFGGTARDIFLTFFQDSQIALNIIISIAVTVLAGLLSFLLEVIIKKIIDKKKRK